MSTKTQQSPARAGLRQIAAPFVADPATGVCIRTRLEGLTAADADVLRQVGAHLGRLVGADLSARVRNGLGQDTAGWAERKRDLTVAHQAKPSFAQCLGTVKFGMMKHALLTIAAMASAAVVVVPAPAHADDNSYLARLDQSGVSIPQTDNVRLTTGRYICGRLGTRATWQDLVRELTNTFFYSPEAADVQIQAAKSELCS